MGVNICQIIAESWLRRRMTVVWWAAGMRMVKCLASQLWPLFIWGYWCFMFTSSEILYLLPKVNFMLDLRVEHRTQTSHDKNVHWKDAPRNISLLFLFWVSCEPNRKYSINNGGVHHRVHPLIQSAMPTMWVLGTPPFRPVFHPQYLTVASVDMLKPQAPWVSPWPLSLRVISFRQPSEQCWLLSRATWSFN